MTTIDLGAIRKRCEALNERLGETARPWQMEETGPYGLYAVYDGDRSCICRDGVREECDFIANSRADVPNLVAEVERLRSKLDYAAAREVAARHFAQQFSDGVLEMLRPCAGNTNIAVWKTHRDEALNSSKATATLLERLAKAEAEARQLHERDELARQPVASSTTSGS